MNEPDRPRRDVSIEEAQRMPMGEGEAIVPSWEDVANRWERAYNEVCEERDALVAEVRRLRAESDARWEALMMLKDANVQLREERRQHWNRWDPTNASDAT